MSEISDSLFGAVESVVNQQIDSTPIDLTITGTIVTIQNVSTGEYKINYKDSVWSAYSLDPLTVYTVNDEVYVLVPKGDFGAKKIIMGGAAFDDSVTYADRQQMSNQWKTRGPNWLSHEWYWKNSTGEYRTENLERKGTIIATAYGEESNITNHSDGTKPSWRNYIFWKSISNNNPAVEDDSTITTAQRNRMTIPAAAYLLSEETFSEIDKEFQYYANQFEYVMVSAEFETNFQMIHSSGEYGILVECWIDNPKYGLPAYPDEPQCNLTSFRFDFSDFNGAPYQFNQSTPQQAVFAVPAGTLKGLVRVSVFQDKNWKTDITPVYLEPEGGTPSISYKIEDGAMPMVDNDNIIAKNIDIRWCESINLTDNLFWLWVETPQGTSLYKGDPGVIPAEMSVPLKARLFYGSQELTSKETCKFIWFRQKHSATMEDTTNDENDEYGRNWHDYGGNGWAPIEKLMQLPSEDEEFGELIMDGDTVRANQYSFDDPDWHQVLNVGIESVPWEWKYKVVCVYNSAVETVDDKVNRIGNEVILDEIETVRNLSSIHDFEIPTPWISPYDTLTYIRVRNNALPWVEDVNYDTTDPSVPDPKKDWWCRWWVDYAGGSYMSFEDATVHITERHHKGRTLITPFLEQDWVIIKAQVFGKKEPLSGNTVEEQVADSASLSQWTSTNENGVTVTHTTPQNDAQYGQYEIANLEYTITKSDEFLLMVDWEGTFHHSYTSSGSILLQSSIGAEFYIRAILTWKTTNIQDAAVEWIAPDGTPLAHWSTSPTDSDGTTGLDVEDSMMHDMWVSSTDRTVHYKVEQKYDINKTNNTYTLRVTLVDGTVLTYQKEVTFSKAGQNGTQGSEWEARIWATNSTISNSGGTGISMPSFTEEIRKYARPLVVEGNYSASGGSYNSNANYRLFLRPFVYKNGVRIEDLGTVDEYTYRVYWDCRYPNVKDSIVAGKRYGASNSSFLKFKRIRAGASNDFGGAIGTVAAATATSDIATGEEITTWEETPRSITPGTEVYSNGTTSGSNTIPIFQSYSEYEDTCGVSDFTTNNGKTYGAVEVEWGGSNVCGNNVTFRDMDCDFVVKAQVDIYQSGTGGDVLVATIFSYYPVDILFTNGLSNIQNVFDADLVCTNYPQFVLYSSSGYAPEVEQDYLRFYYGENARNVIDPLPFTAAPLNLTEEIQTIDLHSSQDILSWRLYPRAYYFFESCANGAIATDFQFNTGQDGWASSSRPGYNSDMAGWDTCTYVRPIVYMINAYGNEDINGWDGKSIDINDANGTIFAPTIGAGYKDALSNKFTGVIMGIDTSHLKSTYQHFFGGFSDDAIAKNPYMTGLFGYQDGVSSFGILENGTAFFGRADTGGRIIIDGYNAQIYGGFSGEEMSGSVAMDMTNRMRLSFIDFSGIADTTRLENTANIEVDGYRVDTGQLEVDWQFRKYFTLTTSSTSSDEDDETSIENLEDIGVCGCGGTGSCSFDSWINGSSTSGSTNGSSSSSTYEADDYYKELLASSSGFGSGMGYSTPAIEIGQYEGKGSDLIRTLSIAGLRDAGTIGAIKDLEIPGKRRFLVTYDGTMYAMNAFVKGNIVGSNIVGSQFFNEDASFAVTVNGNLGIGKTGEVWKNTFVNGGYSGLWSSKTPTTTDFNICWALPDEDGQRKDFLEGMFNFYVSNTGVVLCKEIHIAGGSLNIGTFHIIGPKASISGTTLPSGDDTKNGDVVSYGCMYLVGEKKSSTTTDESGSSTVVGIPPSSNVNALEAWGDIYFRGQLTNLGTVYLGGSYEKNTYTNSAGTAYRPTSFNSPISLTPAIANSPALSAVPEFDIKGGFWPLYFHMTTPSNTKNSAWVTLSTESNSSAGNNGYMPGFAKRFNRDFTIDSAYTMSENVLWRLDQVGMWTDALLFSKEEWVGKGHNQTNLTVDKALAYMGWFEGASPSSSSTVATLTTSGSTGGTTTASYPAFAILNQSRSMPSMRMATTLNLEAYAGYQDEVRTVDSGSVKEKRHILLSSIKGEGSGTVSGGQLFLSNHSENDNITSVLGKTNDNAILSGAQVAVTGWSQTRTGYDNPFQDMECYTVWNGNSYNVNSDTTGEYGLAVGAGHDYQQGTIYSNGRRIVFDGVYVAGATPSSGLGGTNASTGLAETRTFNSSIRINTPPDGGTNASGVGAVNANIGGKFPRTASPGSNIYMRTNDFCIYAGKSWGDTFASGVLTLRSETAISIDADDIIIGATGIMCDEKEEREKGLDSSSRELKVWIRAKESYNHSTVINIGHANTLTNIGGELPAVSPYTCSSDSYLGGSGAEDDLFPGEVPKTKNVNIAGKEISMNFEDFLYIGKEENTNAKVVFSSPVEISALSVEDLKVTNKVDFSEVGQENQIGIYAVFA